jgi:hypothetical protein
MDTHCLDSFLTPHPSQYTSVRADDPMPEEAPRSHMLGTDVRVQDILDILQRRQFVGKRRERRQIGTSSWTSGSVTQDEEVGDPE